MRKKWIKDLSPDSKPKPSGNGLFVRNRLAYTAVLTVLFVPVIIWGGPTAYYLFYAGLLIPVMGLLQLVLTRLSLKMEQTISAEAIEKGAPAVLKVTVHNRGPVPASYLRAELEDSQGFFDFSEGITAGLLPFGRTARTFALVFQHRGAYRVGISRAWAGDAFMLIQIRLPRPRKTRVYVYPKQYRLSRYCPSCLADKTGSLTPLSFSGEMTPDTRRYIPGDALSQIHWKLSARRDEWMTRQREPENDMRILLLLDLTPAEGPDKLAVEDAVIEGFLAAALYFLENGVGLLAVCALKRQILKLDLRTNADYMHLYRSVALAEFAAAFSVSELLVNLPDYGYTQIFTALAPEGLLSEQTPPERRFDILRFAAGSGGDGGSAPGTPARRVFTLPADGGFIQGMEAIP